MESKTRDSVEIPSALPGFEEEDAREKLLLDATPENTNAEDEDEDLDIEQPATTPKKRGRKVLRTVASFALFLFVMIFAVSWFFAMGWFAKPQTRPVSRGGSKDAPTAPMTEDEKLKMALSMVATKGPDSPDKPDSVPISKDGGPVPDSFEPGAVAPDNMSVANTDQNKIPSNTRNTEYSLRLPDQKAPQKATSSNPTGPPSLRDEPRNDSGLRSDRSDDGRGRSLFFGIERKPIQAEPPRKVGDSKAEKKLLSAPSASTQIPFGTLIPVRLVGSIYTLRNSGGFVRLELTRPVEGQGYVYPAGTTLVGNVRGRESIRAFVTIIGLIDPVSGELVRFSGELLGRDGASGIVGHKRKLTSQWSRFFAGLKDTAASVLGSVGAIRSGRSGSTVILQEQMGKGSESMSEGLSNAILKNGKDDTFIEVSAGANAYVLVTGLPENSPVSGGETRQEAGSK
ncbi:MAG: hypothetical protein ACRD6X_15780 [Pyrinomonadaceae bacterium]